MGTSRPAGIDAGPHTADDGLFGPDSITWQVMAQPATAIGAATAAMIQMLYPPVMYVVDQASNVREDPDLRAQRTSDYATTITYGDKAAAEQAGATLRRIHSYCKAVDPDTGVQIVADEPHLLTWVHNALTWSLLGAWRTFGPSLSAAETDQFVSEQKISARLVGCDLDDVASSHRELEEYMTSMEPRLAFTAPCVWFRDLMSSRPEEGGLGATAVKALMVQASAAVMSEHHRALYGFSWGPVRQRLVLGATRALLSSAEKKLPPEGAVGQLRQHVDTHAFGASGQRTVSPATEPVGT